MWNMAVAAVHTRQMVIPTHHEMARTSSPAESSRVNSQKQNAAADGVTSVMKRSKIPRLVVCKPAATNRSRSGSLFDFPRA